jgi:hypothetical protein
LREFKAKPVVGVAVRTINERVLHILHGNGNGPIRAVIEISHRLV